MGEASVFTIDKGSTISLPTSSCSEQVHEGIEESRNTTMSRKKLYLNIFHGTRVLALLWVALCCIRTTNAASHSMKFLYTAVTVGTDFQKFTVVGFVDDEQFMYYDSNTKRMIPKTEWIKEIEGEDFWDSESQKVIGKQLWFREIMGILHFNQDEGVHTLQFMYGCKWDDETWVTAQFNRLAYDGRDFVLMDTQKYRYNAHVQEAFETASAWNHPAELERCRQFLNQTCVWRLKKYFYYGKSGLQRTVAPEVSLLQQNSSSPVTCHVTGFFPRGAMVTWQKDGEYQDVDVELGETVPNLDGTFQIRSHLRVKPEAWKRDRYTCTVQHKSLKQPIVLQVTEWNIKSSRDLNTHTILGCVVGALLLLLILLIVIAVFIWRKKSSGYGKTSTSDTASESSNPPAAPGPDSADIRHPLVSVTVSESSNQPAGKCAENSEDSGRDSMSSTESGPSNTLLVKPK